MENLKILLLFYYINDSVCYIKQLFLKYFRKKNKNLQKQTFFFFNFKENLLCYDIKEKLFFLKNYCYVKVMQHNGL